MSVAENVVAVKLWKLSLKHLIWKILKSIVFIF